MAEKVQTPKKKSKFFSKIPTHVIFSPAGFVLIFFALVIEVIDWIPLPLLENLWELPMEIAFIALAITLVKELTIQSMLLPFIVERIPFISDIVPSFLIKLFV